MAEDQRKENKPDQARLNYEVESKPYKGHLSYEVEDSGIFFGRSREADQLIAKILASPFTLVHAQSGAGKTSLLNARVIPGLEERGWTVALARPHFNPSLSLRTEALRQILPPPMAEAEALVNTKAKLFPNRDAALQEILDSFDLLELRDSTRVELLQPLRDDRAGGRVRPLFFRLLRATLEIKQYGEHIEALLDPKEQSDGGAALDSHVSVSALHGLLNEPRLAAAHSDLTGGIMRNGPKLKPFVEQLLARYGQHRTKFGLVLIVDQFEELFTRFTGEPVSDSNASLRERPSWKLRVDFFDELREVYEATPALPVHIVLSMRDEYIAQLDPLRRFVRELDAASYHLTLLEKEEAHASIREPARLFGYDYKNEVYEDIDSALLREDRFIEPSHLQIVCEKLWVNAGRKLAKSGRPLEAAPELVDMSALPPGGAKKVLQTFFSEYLQSLDEADTSGWARLEALEVLDSLIVVESGTRNIIERKALQDAPFRDPQRRLALIESLKNKRIIRLEPRLGGEFAEITHEFLIPSIRECIMAELNGNNDYAGLRWALRAVMRYKDVDFREGAGNLLPRAVFTILDRDRDKIYLGGSAVEQIVPELMLRSALALDAKREVIEYWQKKLAEREVALGLDQVLSPERLNDPGRRFLSLYELAIVTQQAQIVKPAPQQADFALRTQLQRANDLDRESVIFWTRQVSNHVP